ncbi:hypothetical protein F2Q69_00047318 [Brassica cretica]|uniref:Uncharacterized protein n=1 Tax=Brassica cretica TaxID=69181 RepID=A0A8S9PVJ9_BRACR|nr:hypothetical protein F2Q69_00047318 [Brassica cretica]
MILWKTKIIRYQLCMLLDTPYPHLHIESSLVRLALNALQGVESSLISIHKLSSVLCSEPANRTTHQIPSLWHRTHFRNFKLEVEGQGGDVLEGYISGMDTLCASAELRRSSNIVVYTSAFWITGLLILDNKRFSNVRKYVAAMIQQPRVPSSGLMPASDVLIRAKEVITSRDILVGLLSKHTGNPYYMDAPKAKEFGVIDRAPEKVVFHLVTNEINYAAMKSWFAMNMDNLRGLTVEV